MTHLGTYNELLASSSSFAKLLEDIHQHKKEKEEPGGTTRSLHASKQSLQVPGGDDDEEISALVDDVDIKQEGTVGWRVYRSFIRAGLGSLLVVAVLVMLFVIQQTTTMFSRWWLASWSDDENHRHQIFYNCTKFQEQTKIDRIRRMSLTEWNDYRNNRLMTYCRK